MSLSALRLVLFIFLTLTQARVFDKRRYGVASTEARPIIVPEFLSPVMLEEQALLGLNQGRQTNDQR